MNLAEILVTAQQVLWFAMMVMGLELLLVGVSLKEDKSFILLGTNILILSLLSGVDIWILYPSINTPNPSKYSMELWNNIYQILACSYLIATTWQTRAFTAKPGAKLSWALTAGFLLFALAFSFSGKLPGIFLIRLENGYWQTSWIYDFIFSPYCIIVFTWQILLMLRHIPKASEPMKKVLKWLSISYFALLCGTIPDFIFLFGGQDYFPIPSGVEFGILVMGIIGTFIFTDKLIHLYTSQRRALLKISEINESMEAQRPLHVIGESAARVSEVIKTQVSLLSNRSSLLEAARASSQGEEIIRIEKARRNLERFTSGILDFASSSRIGERKFIKVNEILESARNMLPLESQGNIHISKIEEGVFLGVQDKFTLAIYHILKNSLEAKSASTTVHCRLTGGILSIVIDDQGVGCPKDLIMNIVQPFYTTRKDEGAMGLGASIAEGIIRAHGGAIRFYSKMGSGESGTGMLVNILFPSNGQPRIDMGAEAGHCLLVSRQPQQISEIVSICVCLGLRSSVFEPELFSKKVFSGSTGPKKMVLIGHLEPGLDFQKWASEPCPVYRIGSDRMIYPVSGSSKSREPMPICEDSFLHILGD